MARPKKPTNVLNLAGAFKKNPNRARPDEPKPVAGIGPAPRHFDSEHKKIWRELAKICAPGVLTRQDRIALEIIVLGVHEVRYGLAIPTDRDRVFKQLGKFGMTPSERSNVLVPKQKPQEKKFGSL